MDNWEIYYRTHAKGVGKELTGSPPLSFVSNGQPLADYRIYGASGGVGDRTENLFDKSDIVEGYFININGVVNQNENFCYTNFISVTNGLTYSLGGLMTKRDSWTLRVHGYNSSGNWISEIGEKVIIDAVPISLSFTIPNGIKKIRLSIGLVNRQNLDIVLLEQGATLSAYEPYGYKIPIVCGGTTTNIYLDEPLNEGESISMSDTGVSIPTINGTNILTVDTAVQPSNMYIKYGGSNVNQSLMKYLEYKYKFAKE